MVETKKFEGVVFRKADDAWDVVVQRAKLTITIDLYIVGYEEGQGRLAGTLGTILARQQAGGPVIRVGGGLSDSIRRIIWSDQRGHLGRYFTCECKKIFNSGLPRHPNFVQWHADKK
jgi:DNA ligase-1